MYVMEERMEVRGRQSKARNGQERRGCLQRGTKGRPHDSFCLLEAKAAPIVMLEPQVGPTEPSQVIDGRGKYVLLFN